MMHGTTNIKLVFVTLYVCIWSAGWVVSIQPADQTPPIQSDKYQCRIDTVISPEDGHMDARNM